MRAKNTQPADAPRASIRLPRRLWERLGRLARLSKRSRNTEIFEALMAHAHAAECASVQGKTKSS